MLQQVKPYTSLYLFNFSRDYVEINIFCLQNHNNNDSNKNIIIKKLDKHIYNALINTRMLVKFLK